MWQKVKGLMEIIRQTSKNASEEAKKSEIG